MKPINFRESASQKIYADYINRIKRMIKPLTKEDGQEVLMEFNSHIYESFQSQTATKENEVDRLLLVLEKLGVPEEVVKPIVAELKLNQAIRTFNPLHIFKALALNITNGVFYIFISFLYLFLFGFVFVIAAKVIKPSEVGMYFKNGSFRAVGALDDHAREMEGVTEVLGNWFIPVMVVATILLYTIITLLLRIKRKKK